MKKEELEVYLHIPFCVRKCRYCDFLSAPGTQEQQAAYIRALQEEIAAFPYDQEHFVSTVFFGGGTPSLLPAGSVCRLMEQLRERFDFAPEAEISLECNPGTADQEKLNTYRRAGINRLSLGLQSANDQELKLLGRIHTWEQFLQTYEAAREAGFDNINIDLMSSLPGQTPGSWEETLGRVLALKPEHISAYSLIIEEGTPFYQQYHEDAALREAGDKPRFLPSEEDERRMYEITELLLLEEGLYRYEISNYARPGRECRHNIGYWRGTDYAGFGLGASSLLRHVRYRNPSHMPDYLAGDFSGREQVPLSVQNQMEEYMFLGLRMMEGVSFREFEYRFGKTMDEVYGKVISREIGRGLLERKKDGVRLTPRGIDLSNIVMAEFLL